MITMVKKGILLGKYGVTESFLKKGVGSKKGVFGGF